MFLWLYVLKNKQSNITNYLKTKYCQPSTIHYYNNVGKGKRRRASKIFTYYTTILTILLT